MPSSIRSVLTAVVATMATLSNAIPTENQQGLTTAELLEYRSLEDTANWSGMSKIVHHSITNPGETIEAGDHSLLKRKGANGYLAYATDYCTGDTNYLFRVSHYGCGVCVSVPNGTHAMAGGMWREKVGKPYPTADWYPGEFCQGNKLHHMDVYDKDKTACHGQGLNIRYQSVMLFQGCHKAF